MICSQCWSAVPSGKGNCPRCGAKVTGEPPSLRGLFKTYPWLGVLLGASALLTVWAVVGPRRKPAAPEAIPQAIEPVVEAPPPAPEAEEAPPSWPVPPVPEEPAAAPAAPKPASEKPEPLSQTGSGAWQGGDRPPAR